MVDDKTLEEDISDLEDEYLTPAQLYNRKADKLFARTFVCDDEDKGEIITHLTQGNLDRATLIVEKAEQKKRDDMEFDYLQKGLIKGRVTPTEYIEAKEKFHK